MVYFSTVFEVYTGQHSQDVHLIHRRESGPTHFASAGGATTLRRTSSERLRPAGPFTEHHVSSGPAYGSAFAFAGCLPFRFATAQ